MYWTNERFRRVSAFLSLLAICHLPIISASELTWTGNGGIFFDDAGNWNPGQSPTSADNLTFNAGAAGTSLVISGALSVGEMHFLGGEYSMQGGLGSNLNSQGNLIDGGLLTAAGANTAWGADGGLTVGDVTSGTLNVENEALVTHLGLFLGNSALGQGTVNVTNSNFGTSSVGSFGRIGVSGIGTMNITAGGRSDMSSALIGQFVGSTGTVNVDGAGSDFVTNNFDMRAGDAGAGHINITNGGRIVATGAGNLIAGNLADSTGTISVNAGIVDVGGRTYVGNAGTGTFTATNGSTVNSNLQVILGFEATGAGTATLDGAGTTLSVDNSGHDLLVGWNGLGQMFIKNGASASIPNDVFVGYRSASAGDNRLEITAGSSLNFGNATSDDFFVGFEGNGTLLVNGGSTVNGNYLVSAEAAGSTGNITIDGAGTTANLKYLFAANAGTGNVTVSDGAQINVINSDSVTGNIAVGDSGSGVGTLTITGTNSIVTANKRPEIGGSFNEDGGTGTVQIENGGSLVAPGAVIGFGVTNANAADGTVNVDGAGSSWDSSGSDLFLGYKGDGRVNVTNGGNVTASGLRMGAQINSKTAALTLDGAGSSVTVTGNSVFGESRAATVEVRNGATLNTAAVATIGSAATADGATVTIDGATWNHTGSRIQVGASGGSALEPTILNVKNGGTVTSAGHVMVSDNTAGSHGILDISGTGSSVSGTNSVIGDAGAGTLRVTNGASFDLSGVLDISGQGVASAIISGTGASVTVAADTAIGRSNGSNGTLTIAAGGQLTTGSTNIAEFAGSTGTLNMNIGGTLLVNSGSMLTVGGANGSAGGNGTLNIQGGSVNVASNTVAVTANGTVNLSAGELLLSTLTRAAGADFNFTGGKLSMAGNQVLNSSGLADIFNANATLGSDMTLEVVGTASLDAELRIHGGTFSVGSIANVSKMDWDSGTFALTASNLLVDATGLFGDQLHLNSNQHLTVAQQIINNGLIVSGGTVSTTGGLVNNGDLVLSNNVVNGTLTTPFGSTVTVIGNVEFNGAVSGAGNFYGPGNANFNGGYNPGDSPAIVSFEGDMTLGVGNTLFVEIGGSDNSSAAQFDQMLVEGVAMLNGALDVSLIDLGTGTYAPHQGDSFPILTAMGGFGGVFSDLNLPTLGGGLTWQLNSGGNTLFLDVIGGIINGDFDNDGDLDGDDVDSLVANVAAMTNDLLFDLTGEGSVDGADLMEWLALGGAANLASGSPYLLGDATLDGSVDGQDFLAWNASKFTNTPAWTSGDFNADGVVDGQDFLIWNSNKFVSSGSLGNGVAVPEPNGLCFGLLVASLFGLRLRRDGA